MNCNKMCNRINLIVYFVAAAIIGTVAGILSLTNFYFMRYAYWIGLGVGLLVYLLMLLSTTVRDFRFSRCVRSYTLPLVFSETGLILFSVIGVLLIDARNALHAAVFGLVIAFFVSTLGVTFDFFANIHRIKACRALGDNE